MTLAVIIASCNREGRAFATAQSLLDSRIGKVVLVDDGSSKPYQCRSSHEQLTLLRLPANSGPSAARNHGVLSVQSDWIIFLDDDDSLEANWIDWVQAHANSTLKNFDLVHFGYNLVDINRNKISAVEISTSEKPCVLSGSWMMRRGFFQKIGGYEEKLRYSENSDLIDRAVFAGARTLHAGFTSLSYTAGRPKRREEMAARRAEACIFYLNNRFNHNRNQTLKIGLINSWWNRNPWLALRLAAAFILPKNKSH